MVFPIRGDRSGFRRCDTRKISEFMNQMGLVVITVLESQFAPGDLFAADNLIQDGLKTLNAEIRFGGESDRILELPNEALVSDRLIRCIVFYCEAGVRSTGCLLSSAGGRTEVSPSLPKKFPPIPAFKEQQKRGAESLPWSQTARLFLLAGFSFGSFGCWLNSFASLLFGTLPNLRSRFGHHSFSSNKEVKKQI